MAKAKRKQQTKRDWLGLRPWQWLATALIVLAIAVIAQHVTSTTDTLPAGVRQGIVEASCGDHCTQSNVEIASVRSCQLNATDLQAGVRKVFDVVRHADVESTSTGAVATVSGHYTAFEKANGAWESDSNPNNQPCWHS